jgi:hypothetical protein
MKSAYCVFEYLYRDAGNYKSHGELLLEGPLQEGDIAEIRESLESGEYFIPERVGIPELRSDLYEFSDGPTDDDHIFHEFVALRAATIVSASEMNLWGTLKGLKQRLINSSESLAER